MKQHGSCSAETKITVALEIAGCDGHGISKENAEEEEEVAKEGEAKKVHSSTASVFLFFRATK